MTKIALFGTSADPPTAAHQAILGWLAQHYDEVAVWASDNPFKDHQASLDERQEMLQIVIDELENDDKNVNLHKELSDRRSLNSVAKAQKIWGNEAEYSLVIGSDLVRQIRKWYRVEELLQQVCLLIMPRPGYPIKDEDLAALRNLGGNYAVADVDLPAVSSTDYREVGKESLLTQSVKNYIKRKQLYA